MNLNPEPNDHDEDPDVAPSIRRHLARQSWFEILGSIGAPMAWVFYKFQSGHGMGTSVSEGALFFSLFILGYLIPHAIFRHLVGAACPSPGCRGKIFPKGRSPVVYVCAQCGASFPIGLSEGGDSL